MAGLFVTFEGIEASGKTTQIRTLATRLRDEGYDVVVTREPGGTPVGETIRELLLARSNEELDSLAELLLFEADRAQHVARVIRPALEAGRVVISDRFYDASTAYQQGARGLAPALVERLNALAAGARRPDLTILLDMAPERARGRIQYRMGLEGDEQARFEMERVAFHRAVRAAYLEIAQRESGRFRVVDADRSTEEVTAEVQALVSEALEHSGVRRSQA